VRERKGDGAKGRTGEEIGRWDEREKGRLSVKGVMGRSEGSRYIVTIWFSGNLNLLFAQTISENKTS